MNENGKRPYIRVVYVVLLTFFVSILYYGRIYHFGIIPWDGETISLNVVDEAKKMELKMNLEIILLKKVNILVLLG